jgi:hypothetical protein
MKLRSIDSIPAPNFERIICSPEEHVTTLQTMEHLIYRPAFINLTTKKIISAAICKKKIK